MGGGGGGAVVERGMNEHCHNLFWLHENNHDGIQNREQCSLKFNKRSRGNNS